MFKKLFSSPSTLAPRISAFERQESTFVIINLVVLAVLLVVHALFSSDYGNPSDALVIALGVAFFLRSMELIWIQRLPELSSQQIQTCLSWLSIVFDLSLALGLSLLTDSDDSPYYVLMVVPILQAAFRFSGLAVAAIVVVADLFTFLPPWFYFHHHPPVERKEYLEAGVTSLTFAIVAFVVWLLVRDVRKLEVDLKSKLVRSYENEP